LVDGGWKEGKDPLSFPDGSSHASDGKQRGEGRSSCGTQLAGEENEKVAVLISVACKETINSTPGDRGKGRVALVSLAEGS